MAARQTPLRLGDDRPAAPARSGHVRVSQRLQLLLAVPVLGDGS